VYPAAGIPELTLRAGGRIVIVNDGATPLDSLAVLRYDDLETVFTQV
jgi:NAD-dependent deacetylase